MMTSDNVDDDGDSDDNDANDMDDGDGNNDNGEVEHDGGDYNDDDNDGNANVDVVEDDNDNRMTMIRWRQVQLDDDDAMAMGSQQHTERSRALCHPSEATINLCWQFGEESTRESENFFLGGRQKRVKVEAIEWRSFHIHSINSKPSGHPSAEKGPEPIPHVSWEWGCAISAMVIMFIDDEKDWQVSVGQSFGRKGSAQYAFT